MITNIAEITQVVKNKKDEKLQIELEICTILKCNISENNVFHRFLEVERLFKDAFKLRDEIHELNLILNK
jgi:hexokinase